MDFFWKLIVEKFLKWRSDIEGLLCIFNVVLI